MGGLRFGIVGETCLIFCLIGEVLEMEGGICLVSSFNEMRFCIRIQKWPSMS